ncbi:hypothetical protein BGZ95_011125 [Linnemannia exigua]|uniref:Uncharacterized protein n=1 Tax=Linnemannia exigua TaxID=604196 RepID=A0AAD4H5W0_9FUNG|nr:hypothetical protein BGZ95_011125 [Linnemannia exigua]
MTYRCESGKKGFSPHLASQRGSTAMKTEIKDALSVITKGLSNPRYFEETLPIHYDITAYCVSCGKEPSDEELGREWTSVLVPRMKASHIKILQETATRLEKIWKAQKRARNAERSEENMDNKMRKLLNRSKFEHREITLDHSSRTLARDFQTLDPNPLPIYSTDDLTLSTAIASATSISPTEANKGHHLLFDPSITETIMLEIDGVDVGASFKKFQCEAASIVNDVTKKLNLERLPMFISWKLPRRYIAFRQHNEDTHAHASLDALISMMFPASHRNLEFSWANRASIGSKDRRGDPNKPDAIIIKDMFEVGFVEIKPPREERHEKAFLEDQWALATFAKDAIDYHLRHERPFKTIPCLQVFGFQLILYKLEFMSGIYVWQNVGVAYLPRDMNDRGVIAGSIALLRTFKHFIKKIETRSYVHTPPRKALDEDLPDELRPRQSNLTPKKRPFFPSTH